MKRAANVWTGLLGVFTIWVAVIVVSVDAQGSGAQEGVVRPAGIPGRAGQDATTLTSGQSAQGLAGDAVCLECHEDQGRIRTTAHGRVRNPRTPMANNGCESCHGPGQAHVEDDDKGHILRFGDTKADARVATRPACRATPRAHTRCGTAAPTTRATSHARRVTACTPRSRPRAS